MQKILVYDADPNFRYMMKIALNSLGYESVLSSDAYGVESLAVESRPQLIVLEYKLPEADGFEILKRLRATGACATTPVIFASKTPKFEVEMGVMNAAGVGYVDKPLDLEQLREAIEGLIGPNTPAPPKAVPPKVAPAPVQPPEAPWSPPPPAFTGESDLDGTRDDVINLD